MPYYCALDGAEAEATELVYIGYYPKEDPNCFMEITTCKVGCSDRVKAEADLVVAELSFDEYLVKR